MNSSHSRNNSQLNRLEEVTYFICRGLINCLRVLKGYVHFKQTEILHVGEQSVVAQVVHALELVIFVA